FDDENSDGHSTQDSIANGKILWSCESAKRKFRDQRAAKGEDLFREAGILFLGDDIHTRAEHPDSLAFFPDRSAMAGRVDAPRHSADDAEPLRGEITG